MTHRDLNNQTKAEAETAQKQEQEEKLTEINKRVRFKKCKSK